MLFDERFVNYGCNKVQYVYHLRHRGYSFFIPYEVFAYDVLHHDSQHRSNFLNLRRRVVKPEMTILCDEYLQQMDVIYPENSTSILSVCPQTEDFEYEYEWSE